MAAKKVRIGMIGASPHYGWGMRSHLPALLGLPEYELTAVCTAHRDTAEESAKHYGARLAFHDYHEMVKHPDIDLVSVSVRTPLHHPLVMAALEAGKHVFCEWPLGANVAQAEEMAALARSKGVCNMVGLQARCAPALLRARELLAEGYVGKILSCNMSMIKPGVLEMGLDRAWQADRNQGAHVNSIASGHSIDALCFCVGEEFKEASAVVATQVPVWETEEPGNTIDSNAPDNVVVSGVLTNGAVASVHVANLPWHGTGWRMEVYGMEGTLISSAPDNVQYSDIRLQGGKGKYGTLEELPVPDRLTWVPGKVPQGQPFNMGQLYRRLAEAIQGGGGADPDFDHALKRHRMLDAFQRSSDQGVKVQIS